MGSERDMDGLLVDWLYGELEGEEKRRFEAYLEGSAEARARAEAMQRTREAFRGLADAQEEPPAAVSAILLHEAAVRARKRPASEREGGFVAWLSGLMRPLVLHPAAAAVATLALVAGVAGTLYVRKADQAPPPARSAAPAPADFGGAEAPAQAPAAERPAAAEAAPPALEPGYVAGLADESTEAELERAAEADDDAERQAVRSESKASAPAESAAPAKAKKKRLGSVSGRVTARDRRRAGAEKSASPMANAISGADPVPEGALGRAQSAELAAPEGDFAQPPPQAAGTLGYRSTGGAETRADEARWARAQSAALARAVEAKKCREAATIANDIRDRAPEYFRREVEGSKTVAPCRWYVAKDREQRLARRKAARKKAADAEAEADAKAEPTEAPAESE